MSTAVIDRQCWRYDAGRNILFFYSVSDGSFIEILGNRSAQTLNNSSDNVRHWRP